MPIFLKTTGNKKVRRLFWPLIFLILLPMMANAELRSGMEARVVVGQPNFDTNGGSFSPNTWSDARSVSTDGKRLILANSGGSRLLIWNSIPTANFVSADIVLGQPNFTSTTINNGGQSARTLSGPNAAVSDGKRLFVADSDNRRVLIYNSIPTMNFASASVVVGQSDFASSSGIASQSTLVLATQLAVDGERLFVADEGAHRVLIWNKIPTQNGTPADVVLGQTSFTATSSGLAANKFNLPRAVYSDGKKLFVADQNNHRILIWNSIPTVNGTPADVVLGQLDFGSNSPGTSQTKMNKPRMVFSDSVRLYVADTENDRILVWNQTPKANNTPADTVIGQADFFANSGSVGRNRFNRPHGVWSDGKNMYVMDGNRVLIFSPGSSVVRLSPQFHQGKALLGKVFHDVNANGIQDDSDERGIEGIKVASDTGIYATTDEDGKYHFPYIETGQHILKIDPSTLPEGSILTTGSPRKITVTEGILTQVSFGVKLGDQPLRQAQGEPLLKVSISEDPVLLKPRLKVEAKEQEDGILFTIDCNYHLFIQKAELRLYDENLDPIDSFILPTPLGMFYKINRHELKGKTVYYQMYVWDGNDHQDRTKVGILELLLNN